MAEDEIVPEEGGEAVSIEDELGTIFDEANKEEADRDEQGRFKAKEVSDATEATEVVEDAGAAPELADTSAEAVIEPETVLDAPASWSATAKANWAGLPRELQDEVLKREGDWQKADGERATQLRGYEPIDAAIAPVRQHLQLNGVEPGQYVAQLVAADQYLRTNPQEAMQWIAQQYGIDLSETQQQAEIDPALAPFVQKINALESHLTQFATNQQQQEITRTTAEIDAFAKDHPHFEEVRQHMGGLIQTGAAADMSTAYDMAVWANQSTRAKMQAEQSTEAEQKRKAEAEDKAKKARRITDTNLSTNGTGGGTTPPQYKTREDELSAIYDSVQGA